MMSPPPFATPFRTSLPLQHMFMSSARIARRRSAVATMLYHFIRRLRHVTPFTPAVYCR